jgi:hypothetical protein
MATLLHLQFSSDSTSILSDGYQNSSAYKMGLDTAGMAQMWQNFPFLIFFASKF